MSRNRKPWMPLLVDDYTSSERVLAMDAHEERAYFRLIIAAWRGGGSIPDDDRFLAEASRAGARWPKVKPRVMGCFELREDGRWYQPKVCEMIAEAEEISEKRRYAATELRWGSAGSQGKTRSERLRLAREKGTHTKEQWADLLRFCENKCVRCGSDGTGSGGIVKDHVVPIYQGGSDGIENLQPLCGRCNTSKGPDRTDHLGDRRREFERLLLQASTRHHEGNLEASECLKMPLHTQSHTQLQKKEKQEAQQQAAQAPEEPSRFVFACQYFQVSERLDAAMATAFPWIDRQAEYRRMAAWCEANPTRTPKKQHGRFVHNWLAKCQPSKAVNDGRTLFERNQDNAFEALEMLRQRRAATAK